MLKSISFCLLMLNFSLVACTHTRSDTNYQDMDAEGYGKSVFDLKEDRKAALFSGNTQTPIKQAYHFSRLAAIEHCQNDGTALAILHTTVDASKKTSYTQVSTDSYTVPAFTQFNGRTYRDPRNDQVRTNTYSYPVTLLHPKFATIFQCAQSMRLFAGLPKFETLSREVVSPFTKDFKGGLLVKSIRNKPKNGNGLLEGDVLFSVDGQRIESQMQLYDKVYLVSVKNKKARLRVIRDKRIQSITAVYAELTNFQRLVNLVEANLACQHIDYERVDYETYEVYESPPICDNYLKKLKESSAKPIEGGR